MKKFTVIILLVLAVFVFLFGISVSHNDFDDFCRMKNRLITVQRTDGQSQEISLVWNREEARLEPMAMENSKEAGAKVKTKSADLNGDCQSDELILRQGILRVWQDGKLIWRSPENWWVDDFFLADANGDGKKEINLSVWKAGDFGSITPFWVKQNDQSIKNHFFVMSLAGSVVAPLWQSSNLEKPNCEFLFSDLDGDGMEELIVLEGEYNNYYICRSNHLAVWRWNGWGFTNEWRSKANLFEKLRLSQDGRSISVSVQ